MSDAYLGDDAYGETCADDAPYKPIATPAATPAVMSVKAGWIVTESPREAVDAEAFVKTQVGETIDLDTFAATFIRVASPSDAPGKVTASKGGAYRWTGTDTDWVEPDGYHAAAFPMEMPAGKVYYFKRVEAATQVAIPADANCPQCNKPMAVAGGASVKVDGEWLHLECKTAREAARQDQLQPGHAFCAHCGVPGIFSPTESATMDVMTYDRRTPTYLHLECRVPYEQAQGIPSEIGDPEQERPELRDSSSLAYSNARWRDCLEVIEQTYKKHPNGVGVPPSTIRCNALYVLDWRPDDPKRTSAVKVEHVLAVVDTDAGIGGGMVEMVNGCTDLETFASLVVGGPFPLDVVEQEECDE